MLVYSLQLLLHLALHTAILQESSEAAGSIMTKLSSLTKRQSWQTTVRKMSRTPHQYFTSKMASHPNSHSNASINETRTCPPWQYLNCSGHCSCGDTPYDTIICGQNSTISVLNCFCITSDPNNSRSELGECIFNCMHARHGSEKRIYRSFPSSIPEINKALCGSFNRQGSLCGSCKDGYYPLVYSYNLTCVRCESTWYNWIEYIAIVYVPLTIFYFIVLFLQVNTTSSYLLGFVLYTQAISFPMMCRILELSYHNNTYYKVGTEVAASLYGFWNLEFFRILNHRTCLRLNFLVTTTLDLAAGIYPLFLIFFTHIGIRLYDANFKPLRIAIKPFHTIFRRYGEKLEIRTSLIDAFSTFYLLSSMKLFNVSYDLLAPTKIYTLNSSGQLTTDYRLYLDGDTTYFGNTHLPFAILAIVVILIFDIMPMLCFSLYPLSFIQNCLAHLPNHWRVTLYILVDNFHGSFKNGTKRGSTDYRWFSGILLATRFLLLLVYTFTLNIMYFVLASMILALLALSIAALQPFKESSKHNHLTPSFLLYLSCAYVSLVGGDISNFKAPQYLVLFQCIGIAVGFTPILYATCLSIYWVATRKFGARLVSAFLHKIRR